MYLNNIYSNCTSFQIRNDLLNSDNLNVVIPQLSNDLQVYNFIVIADPKVSEKYMDRNRLSVVLLKILDISIF